MRRCGAVIGRRGGWGERGEEGVAVVLGVCVGLTQDVRIPQCPSRRELESLGPYGEVRVIIPFCFPAVKICE